jgi:hypothetical protein
VARAAWTRDLNVFAFTPRCAGTGEQGPALEEDGPHRVALVRREQVRRQAKRVPRAPSDGGAAVARSRTMPGPSSRGLRWRKVSEVPI